MSDKLISSLTQIVSSSGSSYIPKRKPTGHPVTKENIECYGCHEMGHYRNECPSKTFPSDRRPQVVPEQKHKQENGKGSNLSAEV